MTKRHAAGAETGACVADPHPFQAILSFGPSGAHSPVPATQSPSRRAQWLSRPALFRAAEGLVLTAASTAAD